ncbi:MAG: membrane protein insertase YidC [Eubacteriaceae bacterium]|jgi:YidC/Oxa1 family membrane protein insertase|nr:membrane protein insertase YidC [Eubacteriaceae bacterium]
MSLLYQAFGFVFYHLYQVVQNYGLTIIIFTILFKLVLLPFNIKQTNSMREMQALQPKIKSLQKKYKNNPEQLNREMTNLYKVYNVNPMSGCLPLLLQMPIMFALFEILRNPDKWIFLNGDMANVVQKFLWIPSLGQPDPLYILPILTVLATFLTQKLTMVAQEGTMDESTAGTQKTMLYMMPIIIGVTAIRFPAGVALYWVVQNIFTMVQQFIMLRRPYEQIDPLEAQRKLETAKREEKKQRRDQRKQQQEMRAEAMGMPTKKKNRPSQRSNPQTKRKTITKVPGRKDRD